MVGVIASGGVFMWGVVVAVCAGAEVCMSCVMLQGCACDYD
jgi:hypothetical protein